LAKNIPWGEIDPSRISEPCWDFLKRTEISNPEKDIVFKLWSNVGLTPKIATSMNLFNGYDCPFCKQKNISTSHYPLCTHFKPLWQLVFKIINKDPNSCVKVVSRGCSGVTTNIFIFYALCAIYKTFVLYLNKFEEKFDYLKFYKQVIFCRLLTEYHSCMRGGASKMSTFLRKFTKFKLFKIINNKININLNL
jgi:hypothetical protein